MEPNTIHILFCICYLGIRLRSQNAELFFLSAGLSSVLGTITLNESA